MSGAPTALILCPQTPFVIGGAEKLADALCAELSNAGMSTDVVSMPFRWEPKEIVLREALAWRMLDLAADIVIPLKFPAYFVKHPCKVPWLQHQFRQLYEFHGTPFSGFSNNLPDSELRRKLVSFDTACLAESKHIFTNSDNTRARLNRYNALEGETLYPPPMIGEHLRSGEYGDYIFAAGRLEEVKRFDLLLRALAETKEPVRIEIAGDGSQSDALRELARELGVADRATFHGRVDEKKLIDLYAGCRAVHFAPLDEDYGLVAIEAMRASRPVITAKDSGGPIEHVEHGETGYVLQPDPAEHAQALDELWRDPDLCKRLGEEGARRAERITWQTVVDAITKWIP